MATQAQIDANRRTALKSTGPRTVNGKRIAANNALKHGLCSEEAVIPGEDVETFAEFADNLRLHMEEDDYSLRNVMLVERVILIRWKLRRLPRLEKLAMDKLMAEHGSGDEAMLAGLVGDPKSATLAKLQQYEMRLNRELRACMSEFRKEYSNRSSSDCHQAYREGYNEGVRVQAEMDHRQSTVPPLPEPERTLEAVDHIYDDDGDGAAAERSQMSPDVTASHLDDAPAAERSQFEDSEELGATHEMESTVGNLTEPSLHPVPQYREREQAVAA